MSFHAKLTECALRSRQIFRAISLARPAVFKAFAADQHLAAACNLIAHSATLASLEDAALEPTWRLLVDLSLKSRNEDVQLALARAWGGISRLVNIDSDLSR